MEDDAFNQIDIQYDIPYPEYLRTLASVSTAISLKRIADALDDGSSQSLLAALRGIEMNGRQN